MQKVMSNTGYIDKNTQTSKYGQPPVEVTASFPAGIGYYHRVLERYERK